MKKLKRELNVLSSNCKKIIDDILVVEDFENLLKISNTTKASVKNSPNKKLTNHP